MLRRTRNGRSVECPDANDKQRTRTLVWAARQQHKRQREHVRMKMSHVFNTVSLLQAVISVVELKKQIVSSRMAMTFCSQDASDIQTTTSSVLLQSSNSEPSLFWQRECVSQKLSTASQRGNESIHEASQATVFNGSACCVKETPLWIFLGSTDPRTRLSKLIVTSCCFDPNTTACNCGKDSIPCRRIT